MKQLLFLCAFVAALGLFRTSVYAAVVINEIFPKTVDIKEEWVELYNTGSETVSLNLWTLANTEGTAKTFVIGADWIIAPHGYLTFNQQRTGITFNINGDTVRLTDDKNTLADSQSYISTLGYNTSMGRSPDGGTSWTVCTTATANKSNDCPPATPTPTASPAPQPTNTPLPTATGIPVPTESQPPKATGVLGATAAPTPTPTPQTDNLITIPVPNAIAVSKTLAVQIAVVAGVWIMLAFIALSRRKRKPRP